MRAILVAPGLLLAAAASAPASSGPEIERPAIGAGEAALAGAPVCAPAGDGGLLVVWESRGPGERDVLFNRRTGGPDGQWLSVPRRLDTDGPGAARSLEVRVRAGPAAHVYAAWQDARSGRDDIHFNRSTDGGLTWLEADVRINSTPAGSSISSMASLAADGVGRVYLVWEDLRHGERDIYFTRSTDFGTTWETDRRVDSDVAGADASYHPQIVARDDGTVLVCWKDERSGLPDLHVRRSRDGGATWEEEEIGLDPGQLGEVAGAGERTETSLLTLADGRLLTARVEETPLGRAVRGEIFDPAGEASPGRRGRPLRGILDEEGALHLLWIDENGKAKRELRYVRIDPELAEIH